MPSYKELLTHALRTVPDGPAPVPPLCTTASGRRCHLCNASTFSYENELTAKRTAVRTFWAQHFPEHLLRPLQASPSGRNYRSISKRKVFLQGRDVVLGLIDPGETETGGILPVGACAIEPVSHQVVYSRITRAIRTPALHALFQSLRYIIVRGDERNTLVILSVTEPARTLMKPANALSKLLTAGQSTVRAVYLYHDESDGRYYLGSSDPAGRTTLRKLYGVQGLKHDVDGRRFFYPPAAFSQVNHAALELLAGTVQSLLHPEPRETLLDLYCGYGLFGLLLAGSYARVVGADISPDSIDAAQNNASRQGAKNVRFLRSTLDEDSVGALVQRCRPPLSIILDPPRGGTAGAMITILAAAEPSRVVHLFCNVERMPAELQEWEKEGYAVEAAVPVDMFPGTAALEIVIGLVHRPG